MKDAIAVDDQRFLDARYVPTERARALPRDVAGRRVERDERDGSAVVDAEVDDVASICDEVAERLWSLPPTQLALGAPDRDDSRLVVVVADKEAEDVDSDAVFLLESLVQLDPIAISDRAARAAMARKRPWVSDRPSGSCRT